MKRCRNCEINELEFRHLICNECKLEYYKFYRPDCEFKFNIFDFKNNFEFTLVNKYGWYSASNKGNNLNGVSKDHMYSVYDGFKNKINPKIISHPANCILLKHTDNNKKKMNSSITLEELLERIKIWDNNYVSL